MSEQPILKCKASLIYPSEYGMKSPIILRLNALYVLCIGFSSVLYADEPIDTPLYEDRMEQGDVDDTREVVEVDQINANESKVDNYNYLDDGEIVSTKGRNISETRKFFAKKGDEVKGKPIIVMINNGSASASEIFAGALKDHKRAIILGESSYGKGSVQSIIPLKNNGAIRLTVSKYYLPSGDSISEVGVKPDIFVAESSDEFRIDTDTDNQLEYALKLLNG